MLAFNSLLPISVQIWSLGCVLAEMFTGYVLFQNDSVQTMLARIQGVLGPFPERSLALARDTAKYMTPNNIVYERVRVRGEQQQQRRRGGRSKKNRGEGKDADEGKVEGGRPSTPPSEGEEEGEEEEEAEEEEEDRFQYLVVYPKHTTLRHRLHTRNRLFVDLIQSLLCVDHEERPTAQQALRHPWLSLSHDQSEEALDEHLWQRERRRAARREQGLDDAEQHRYDDDDDDDDDNGDHNGGSGGNDNGSDGSDGMAGNDHGHDAYGGGVVYDEDDEEEEELLAVEAAGGAVDRYYGGGGDFDGDDDGYSDNNDRASSV